MKVKNIAFSGFVASILMAGAAYAADVPAIATTNYVRGAYNALDGAKQAKLNGTNGNVVTYTGTAGTLGSVGIDSDVTSNSPNLITSGAVSKKLGTIEALPDKNTRADNKFLRTDADGKLFWSEIPTATSTSKGGVKVDNTTVQMGGTNGDVLSVGSIKNDQIAGDAGIAQSKISGLESVQIGDRAKVSNFAAIAIGDVAEATAMYAVAVGDETTASKEAATAIGTGAQAKAYGAIQLGSGQNEEEASFYVALKSQDGESGGNWKLLDVNGKIPLGRLVGEQLNSDDENGMLGQVLVSNGAGNVEWQYLYECATDYCVITNTGTVKSISFEDTWPTTN